MLLVAFAVAAFLVFTAPFAAGGQGTATPTPAAPEMPPVVWELQTMTTRGSTVEPADPAAYTVQFLPDGELRVRADCNRGRASYEIDGQSLRVGPVALTRMGCPAGSHGTGFADLLGRAAAWSFADDKLVLTVPDGDDSLTFAPALEGVVWQWQGFQGSDDSVLTPSDPAAYTVEFQPDGILLVRADCNRGSWGWSAEPPAITIKPGMMTLVGCEEGSLGDRFSFDLGAVSSFVFRDGRLFLALPMDSGIHEFAATVPEAEATPEAGG
jgi:heat shock protein HslJ